MLRLPRPVLAVLVVLAVVAVLVALVLGAYVLGRAQCPPPDWWVRVFAADGNWGCVA